MSGLFGQPKVKTSDVADPNDLENRRGALRARKVAQGGAGSTILTSAMGGGSSAPRSILTGMG